MTTFRVVPNKRQEPIMSRLDDVPGPPPFTCAFSHDEAGTACVDPVGELDLATTGMLGAALEAAYARAPLVLLDLRGLTFIDSAGVRFIVNASIAATRAGHRAVVVADRRQIRVFDLTGASADIELLELERSSTAVPSSLVAS